LNEAYSRPGPSLVVLEIDPDELVLPMVPPGRANAEALIAAPKMNAV
jgi:thiamine pyrophosphate-dependent acetolactate synthase large subunit-like protein